MNIKAIILDVDGTLLNDKKVITPLTKEVLISAQALGFKLILASGKPTRGLSKIAEELAMRDYDGLLVSFNGAKVTNCNNEILFNQTIDLQTAKDYLHHLKQFEVYPLISKGDYMMINDIYSPPISKSLTDSNKFDVMKYEVRSNNYKIVEYDDLAQALEHQPNKILIAAEPKYLLENLEAIAQPFKDKLSLNLSAPFFFEATAKNIDKAKALETVLHQYNITAENCIAFGDAENDRSLLEYAHLGIAMGNAVDSIKAIADDITTSNNDDGIALALKKHLNILN
ncbi:MAG: Cof-type HAD-IIB family hydrolase [Erysipelotrichaceae bacterium]